jgi:hypothetical protein
MSTPPEASPNGLGFFVQRLEEWQLRQGISFADEVRQ